MLNKCSFIGNLGRDPEIRTTQGGVKIANISIGVTDKWTDKQTGQKQERTEWVRCVAFGQLADIMERFLRKGSKVYVEGKLQTRKYQDQSGQDRYSTEIVLQGFDGKLVMLDGPPRDGGQQQAQEPAGGGYADLDDTIPF